MMHNQLTRALPEQEVKAIFLATLREPLQTMCAVIDFQTSTIDQVIDRVMEMDKSSSWLTMEALQWALPTKEDLRFRQVVQCTMCLLTPGHSTVECTMRTQCMVCHSRSHTMDRCEYNLLNREVTPVRTLNPRPIDKMTRKDSGGMTAKDQYRMFATMIDGTRMGP